MARKRSWTDEEFVATVQASGSIREVLIGLGLVPTGGNYKEFHRHCKRLKVETAHFHGQAHLRGKRNPWKKGAPLETILVENSTYSNLHTLKRRLIAEGVLPVRCSSCGGTEWMGRPIPLELDHINGVHDDHRRENLQFLCPNCHALTPTYRGRNKGAHSKLPPIVLR
jgi:hypothetical protein